MGVQAEVPSSWPSSEVYGKDVSDDWRLAGEDGWLCKPKSGIFYHSPSESLWMCGRRAGAKAAYVRLDAAGSSLGRFALAAFGCSQTTVRILLKDCFAIWRDEFQKFEVMDRDLKETSNEACMARLPETKPSICKRLVESHSTVVLGAFCEVMQTFSFSSIFSWTDPCDPTQNANRTKIGSEDTLPQTLTIASLMRHNVQSTFMAPAPIIHEGAFGLMEPHRLPEAIAAVHQDRIPKWRCHVRYGKGIINEQIGPQVGSEVIIRETGDRGFVHAAFEPWGEYSVRLESGEVIIRRDGATRYFKADSLIPVEALKAIDI